MRVLYLSYDGMTDPLGQSQVIAYLKGLSRTGVEFHLISCEKGERYRERGARIAQDLRDAGIDWHPLPYTKSPPVLSTLGDLQHMKRLARALHRRHAFQLVHSRSYVPALVARDLHRRSGVPFVFDIRGFWPEERVDGGLWDLRNPLYRAVFRFFKHRERQLARDAFALVSLTRAGVPVMASWAPGVARKTRVIPCCTDFGAFGVASPEVRAAARHRLGIPADALVPAYLGSIGTWYMFDEVLDFFRRMADRDGSSHLLVVTTEAEAVVHSAARAHGVDPGRVVVRGGSHAEVPALLAAADFGLFFIRPLPSKRSSSPTKLAEFLAMGLPVVTNGGVGDVEEDLAAIRGGAVVNGFTSLEYDAAIERLPALLADAGVALRKRARPTFDLTTGVAAYRAIYDAALTAPSPRSGRRRERGRSRAAHRPAPGRTSGE